MPHSLKENETIVAIDHGTSNIGVAFGRNGIVAPVKVISGKHINTAIHEVNRIAMENKATKFVIGLPLTAEGKETTQSLAVRKFAKLLKIFSKKPVEFYSEYGTTQEAQEEAMFEGIPMAKRHLKDHLSAALILKRYFEEASAS